MKKNGFTMIELIAVITILSVMLLIVLPSMIGIKKTDELRKKEEALNNIYIASENYVMANYDKYTQLDNIGHSEYIKVLALINSEYLDTNTKNPNNDEYFEGDDVIKITRAIDGTFIYSLTKVGSIYEIAKNLVYDNDACKTDGTTYNYMDGCYLKNNQTNNYLWYSGFLWRIMGINNDGSVRIISDINITSISYTDTGTNFKDSDINDWLNTYFLTNLRQTSLIEMSNWCGSDPISNYEGITSSCLGNQYINKIGLLSLNEFYLSGTNSYLNNSQSYWTSNSENSSNAWIINSDGSISSDSMTSLYGIRPVINIDSSTIITSGDGSNNWTTDKHPYLIGDDIDSNNNGSVLNKKATSGEYVLFANKLYRVVSVENNETKMIFDSYYDDNNDQSYEGIEYGTLPFNTTTGIGYNLNNTILNWLTSNEVDQNKIDVSSWYHTEYNVGNSYKKSLLEETQITAQVGLIRIGEILASQKESQNYWLLNYIGSSAWYVNNNSKVNYNDVTTLYLIKPVVVIKSDVQIVGGNGMPNSPYEI